jgi:hypothetical protein
LGYERDSLEGITFSLKLLADLKEEERDYAEQEQSKSPRSQESSSRARRISKANPDRLKNIPLKR